MVMVSSRSSCLHIDEAQHRGTRGLAHIRSCLANHLIKGLEHGCPDAWISCLGTGHQLSDERINAGRELDQGSESLAARLRRSSLEVSASDLAKVRWSCGRNGFRAVGIFSSRLLRVRRIADLTSVERSETTRISGPVIWVTKGLRAPSLVLSIRSEIARAAETLCSAVPFIETLQEDW